MEPIDKSKLAFNLSHSSMDTLERCPYQFYMRYIRKLYPEYLEPNYPAEFGSWFHEASEFYTGTGQEEFKALLVKLKHKYAIIKEYEDKVPLAIKNFLYFYETYLRSAQKIYKEKKIQILLNDYIGFNGSLDVLYQKPDGKWVVVDLKSSKKPSDYSNQLSCYYYLLSKICKVVPKELECQIVYLVAPTEPAVVSTYTLDLQDVEICENRLLTNINKISILGVDDVSKWVKKPTKLCGWCDYYLEGSICDGNGRVDRSCSKIEQK